MLGKMIKHEIKATGRLFLPMYLGSIVLTIAFSFLLRLTENVGKGSLLTTAVMGISWFGYVVMLIALCAATVIVIVFRFYKTVATSEAYLTFSLPVKTNQILNSKLLVALVWQLLSAGMVVLSAWIMFTIRGSDTLHRMLAELLALKPVFLAEYGSVALGFLHLGIIVLTTVAGSTLMFFLAICLGQLCNDHRVIASIGMYMVVYMVGQAVASAVFFPLLMSGTQPMVVGQVSTVNLDVQSIPTMSFFITLTVMQIVLMVAYYIGCALIMKKRTNVR